MSAIALSKFGWPALKLTKRDCLRGVLAGSVWGLALTAGLTAVTAWSCGGICLPEVATNAGLSVAAGILGIGPVAAYGRRY
jgi:hypothetical protein